MNSVIDVSMFVGVGTLLAQVALVVVALVALVVWSRITDLEKDQEAKRGLPLDWSHDFSPERLRSKRK
jgi:hypothetical protein